MADYGWCEVEGNYFDLYNPKLIEPNAWGYCSKDCNLDENEPDSGKLRIVDHVEVKL